MVQTYAHSQFLLLKDRRFLPLFITQFTGAFNDNLFKAAISVMVAYGLISTGTWKPEVIVSLTAGFLILPFILLGPLAGDLADKFNKAQVMRWLKIFELGVIAVAIISLFLHSVVLLLLVLFLFGCQAALFSPAKFSILPQQLKAQELIGGNALLNTGTYFAILAGTIGGSLLGTNSKGIFILCGIFIVSGLLGYFASRFIPKAAPSSPDLKLWRNWFSEIYKMLKHAYVQPAGVFPAILFISWFYFVGAVVLSQFPIFTRQVLQADTDVLAFLMVIFSVGVGIGGLLNNRLLKAKIDARFVPLAAIGMGLFLYDLYMVPVAAHAPLLSLNVFAHSVEGLRVIVDVLGLAVCGGLYVIPLKSIVQHKAQAARRARVMAASALMDSVFILVSSVLAAVLLGKGYTVSELFFGLSVASFAASVYLMRLKRLS